MSRTGDLLKAVQLIETVIQTLDTTTETCDHCGLLVRHNMTEAKAATELRAAMEKIRRHAQVLQALEGSEL